MTEEPAVGPEQRTDGSAEAPAVRGTSEHSAVQSRKLDRNPWGTAPMPTSRTIFEIVASERPASH